MESLSGDWNGSLEISQAGKCSIGAREGREWRRGRVGFKMGLRVDVDPDGRLTVREYKGEKATEHGPSTWEGAVYDDFRVVAVRTSRPSCGGRERELKTRFEGEITKGVDGALNLLIAGREDTCPDIGCIFDLKFAVSKPQ